MNLYGPSALTGVGSVGTMWLTGSPLFAALAVFTLIGAITAVRRVLPRFRRG